MRRGVSGEIEKRVLFTSKINPTPSVLIFFHFHARISALLMEKRASIFSKNASVFEGWKCDGHKRSENKRVFARLLAPGHMPRPGAAELISLNFSTTRESTRCAILDAPVCVHASDLPFHNPFIIVIIIIIWALFFGIFADIRWKIE